jgi:hypothetical protein
MTWSSCETLVTCAENDRLVNVFDLVLENAPVTLTSSEVPTALSAEGHHVIAVSNSGALVGWNISPSDMKSKKTKTIESCVSFPGCGWINRSFHILSSSLNM